MNEVIENKKKSEILAESLSKLNYGDVVMHSQISVIIGEKYPSAKYNSTIQKARKILLNNYGKRIECIIGDGYRVIQPDDYVDYSLKHYKRGFKEMQKGYETLSHAPVKDMSIEGRARFRRVNDRAITLAATMQGARVELKELSKKRHPMAVENIASHSDIIKRR